MADEDTPIQKALGLSRKYVAYTEDEVRTISSVIANQIPHKIGLQYCTIREVVEADLRKRLHAKRSSQLDNSGP